MRGGLWEPGKGALPPHRFLKNFLEKIFKIGVRFFSPISIIREAGG
jgi:hypothetical protein